MDHADEYQVDLFERWRRRPSRRNRVDIVLFQFHGSRNLVNLFRSLFTPLAPLFFEASRFWFIEPSEKNIDY